MYVNVSTTDQLKVEFVDLFHIKLRLEVSRSHPVRDKFFVPLINGKIVSFTIKQSLRRFHSASKDGQKDVSFALKAGLK